MSGRLQRGVSLIEVLVAMTVLAIGLLGMAALLGNAMQFNQGSQARTQAVLLSNDMAERVRANRPNRAAYTMVVAVDDMNCDPSWAPDVSLTVAQNDLAEWFNSVACNLPGGFAQVDVTNNTLSIAVGWTDTTGANVVDEEIFVMSFEI